MLQDLESHSLEVILVPAPEQRHHNHCIRVSVAHNVPWYQDLWNEFGHVNSARLIVGLQKIINNESPTLVWDKIAVDVVKELESFSVNVDVDREIEPNETGMYIPNAFSPNGDGRNDYFIPRELLSSGIKEFSIKIFNRWGELIFKTNSVDGRGWDGSYGGKKQPLGVYIYMIDVQ